MHSHSTNTPRGVATRPDFLESFPLDDLDGLPPERLTDRANTEHVRMEECFKGGILHAREAGRLLTAARAKVPHGEWERWVRDHCVFEAREARRYIRLAREWDRLTGKSDTPVSDLSFRQALELLTDKRPEAAPTDPNLLTWDWLVRLRPELGALLAEAEAVPPGQCVGRHWLGAYQDVPVRDVAAFRAVRAGRADPHSLYARVLAQAGWAAPAEPGVLHTYQAHDLALEVIFDALPPCPDGCPCGGGEDWYRDEEE
jgi:hypothetical protein